MAEMIEVRRRLVRRAGQLFPVREVEFVREGQTLAALVEGDPLLRALDMPLLEVERLRVAYAPAIVAKPQLRAALDAILEYKREQDEIAHPEPRHRRPRHRRGTKV